MTDSIPAYSEVQFCSISSSKGLTGIIYIYHDLIIYFTQIIESTCQLIGFTFAGTSGKVTYRLADNPAVKFEFLWDNPWMESRSAVCHVVGTQIRKTKNQKKIKIAFKCYHTNINGTIGGTDRFTVEQTANKRSQYEVTWAIEQISTASPLSRSSGNLNVSKILNEEGKHKQKDISL